MTTLLAFSIPIVFATGVLLWAAALISVLREERSYTWLIVLLLGAPVAVPVYWLNFLLLGDPIGRWWHRQVLMARIEQLREQQQGGDVLGRRRELAEALMDLGDWKGALAELKVLLDRDPEDLKFQFLAGKCLARLGRHDAAIVHLAYVVEADPLYLQGTALNLLAISRREVGDLAGALEALDQLRRRLFLPHCELMRAGLLLDLGRRDEAAAALRELLERCAGADGAVPAAHRHTVDQARALLERIGGRR